MKKVFFSICCALLFIVNLSANNIFLLSDYTAKRNPQLRQVLESQDSVSFHYSFDLFGGMNPEHQLDLAALKPYGNTIDSLYGYPVFAGYVSSIAKQARNFNLATLVREEINAKTDGAYTGGFFFFEVQLNGQGKAEIGHFVVDGDSFNSSEYNPNPLGFGESPNSTKETLMEIIAYAKEIVNVTESTASFSAKGEQLMSLIVTSQTGDTITDNLPDSNTPDGIALVDCSQACTEPGNKKFKTSGNIRIDFAGVSDAEFDKCQCNITDEGYLNGILYEDRFYRVSKLKRLVDFDLLNSDIDTPNATEIIKLGTGGYNQTGDLGKWRKYLLYFKLSPGDSAFPVGYNTEFLTDGETFGTRTGCENYDHGTYFREYELSDISFSSAMDELKDKEYELITYHNQTNANPDNFLGLFDSTIAGAVAKLDEELTSLTGMNYTYADDEKRHHLIGLPDAVGAGIYSAGVQYPYVEDRLMYLNHKLQYLKESTGKEVYVFFHKVDFVSSSPSIWMKFSEEVYKRSSLRDKDAILVTVPYVDGELHCMGCTGIYSMPGIYFKSSGIMDKPAFKTAFGNLNFGNVQTHSDAIKFDFVVIYHIIETAYKYTRKPYTLHVGYLSADGSMAYEKKVSPTEISGKNYCKEIVLVKKPEYDQIQDLVLPRNCFSTMGQRQTSIPCPEDIALYNFKKAQLIIQSKTSGWVEAREFDDKRIKEKFIDDLAEEYVSIYVFKGSFNKWWIQFKDVLPDYTGYVMTNNTNNIDFSNSTQIYGQSKWVVLDPVIYGVLDVTSLGLSFVGMDILPEGIGLLYASCRGDAVNITIYSVSIVVAGGSSGVVRIMKHSANLTQQGFAYIVREGVQTVSSSVVSINKGSWKNLMKLDNAAALDNVGAGQLDQAKNWIDNGKLGGADVAILRSQTTDAKKIGILDDMLDIDRRLVSLDGTETTKVKQWLDLANNATTGTNKVYIVVHGSGNSFQVTVNGAVRTMDHRSLAKWIQSSNLIGPSDDIVLLSCSNLNSAANLSNKLNRKVIATSGDVKIHNDGGISTSTPWKEIQPNAPPQTMTSGMPNGPGSLADDFVSLGKGTPDGTIIGNKVDGIYIAPREAKKLLPKLRKGTYYGMAEIDAVRYFRILEETHGLNAIQLFSKVGVSGDLVRVKVITDKIIASNPSQLSTKLDNLFAGTQAKISSHSTLIKVVDNYLPNFIRKPISNIKPLYFNNTTKVFDDINMQHILDKHSAMHFDFNNIGVHAIDMFPLGTTQRQVAGYIDEALNILKTGKGPNYPINGNAEPVQLASGMKVIIGSNPGSAIEHGVFPPSQNIIGQFYPLPNEGAITFNTNDLRILKEILE